MLNTEFVSRLAAIDNPERFAFVDALRGVAAFSVLLLHIAAMHNKIVAVPIWAAPFVLNGIIGVYLFFIVSAFCLCLTTRKHRQEANGAPKFYLRRVFRIVPLFYVLLVITLLRDKAIGSSHSLPEVFRSVFFLFNFIPGQHEGIVWASWTLGVEMVFYLLFPFIFRAADTLRKSLIFFGLTLGVSVLFRLFVDSLSIPEPPRESFLRFSFFNQLPVFALGIVAFFAYEEFIRGKNRPRRWAYALTGAAFLGYSVLWLWDAELLSRSVVARGTICSVLFLGLAIAPLGIVVNRASRFIGKISYSFYLIHPMVVYALMPVYRHIYARSLPVSLQFAACLMLTLAPLTALAYLGYRFIEQPGIRLGNRLIKKIPSEA